MIGTAVSEMSQFERFYVKIEFEERRKNSEAQTGGDKLPRR